MDVVNDLGAVVRDYNRIPSEIESMEVWYRVGKDMYGNLSSVNHIWKSFVEDGSFGPEEEFQRRTMVRFIRSLMDQKPHAHAPNPRLSPEQIIMGRRVVKFLREQGHETDVGTIEDDTSSEDGEEVAEHEGGDEAEDDEEDVWYITEFHPDD